MIYLNRTRKFFNSINHACKHSTLNEVNHLLLNAKNSQIKLIYYYSRVHKYNQPSVNGPNSQVKIERLNLPFQYEIFSPWNKDYRYILLAYIDACIHINELDSAHAVLLAYSPEQFSYIEIKDFHLDVKLFTLLMHAWAKKGEFEKIEELEVVLRASNTIVVPQLFAAKLECLSRQDSMNYGKVRTVFKEIEERGFTLQSLFLNSIFKMDEKAKIVEVIKRIIPDFVPANRKEEQLGYFSDLLKDFKFDHSVNIFTDKHNMEQLQINLKKQLELEMKGFHIVRSVEKLKSQDKIIDNRKRLNHFLKMYYSVFQETFLKERQRLEDSIDPSQVSIVPFLKVLSPDKFVDLLIQEIITFVCASKYNTILLESLFHNVAERIFLLFRVQSKMKQGVVKKVYQIYSQYLEYYTNPELSCRYHPEEYWNILCKKINEDYILNNEYADWPDSVNFAIGRFLITVLIKCFQVDFNIFKKTNAVHMVPALYLIYRHEVPHSIKPHPVLMELFIRGSSDILHLPAVYIPMLVPPIPWFNTLYGGYLSSLKLMSVLQRSTSYQKVMEEMSFQKLRAYLDTVNMFAAVPWVINKQVLSVMLALFHNNLGEKVGLPVHPKVFYHHAFKKLIRCCNDVICQKSELQLMANTNYVSWRNILIKLSLANALHDEIFWLPHRMDFRGRIYTKCLLRYSGHDVNCGLLKLAKGKILGEKGLDWLKINLVNLTGHKKISSLTERLKFADTILPSIMASADYPLNLDSWWMKTDKPWQVLACCIEITEALRSSDPKNYLSHLLVSQDGTTNMLQHYAALVRDSHIAQLVNLESTSKPQDFYHELIPLIEHTVEQDSRQKHIHAKVSSSFIQRKIIKLAAISSILRANDSGTDIRNVLLQENPHISFTKIQCMAKYLNKKTTLCIKQEFPNIFKFQNWLRKCARIISCQQNIPLEWESPLGLSICQPFFVAYEDTRKFSVDVKVKSETKPSNKDEQNLPKIMKVDETKQQNAFFSNYIHCLDACHMILTALHCHKEKIPFLAVQDNFLTYAATVDRMNKICREQFVKLHSQSLLDNLSQQLIDKFGYTDSEIYSLENKVTTTKKHLNIYLKVVPARGSFNLENVLRSIYFFN